MGLSAFGGVYAGRRVLVTGHTGFKGSWLALWLRTMDASVSGVALEPETDPSHWRTLELADVPHHRVDLRDANAVRQVLEVEQPEFIFHLAAQALVRRSYHDPVETFGTNVAGLVNLLESVRDCPSVRVLVNATTDKVYREYTSDSGYREDDALGGHDPYSTSKACAELITDCYRKSFLAHREPPVHVATARAGNVFGGGDWAEDRLIPDLVGAAISGEPLQLRNPAATRPWQHVLEPLSGYLRLGQMLWTDARLAEAWNFGPGRDAEVAVGELVARMQSHWPKLQVAHDHGAHPREAPELRLDADKAHQRLGWAPIWTLDTALARTAAWYRAFHERGEITSRSDLAAFLDAARKQEAAWAT